jgi:hypothetical protein
MGTSTACPRVLLPRSYAGGVGGPTTITHTSVGSGPAFGVRPLLGLSSPRMDPAPHPIRSQPAASTHPGCSLREYQWWVSWHPTVRPRDARSTDTESVDFVRIPAISRCTLPHTIERRHGGTVRFDRSNAEGPKRRRSPCVTGCRETRSRARQVQAPDPVEGRSRGSA